MKAPAFLKNQDIYQGMWRLHGNEQSYLKDKTSLLKVLNSKQLFENLKVAPKKTNRACFQYDRLPPNHNKTSLPGYYTFANVFRILELIVLNKTTVGSSSTMPRKLLWGAPQQRLTRESPIRCHMLVLSPFKDLLCFLILKPKKIKPQKEGL